MNTDTSKTHTVIRQEKFVRSHYKDCYGKICHLLYVFVDADVVVGDTRVGAYSHTISLTYDEESQKISHILDPLSPNIHLGPVTGLDGHVFPDDFDNYAYYDYCKDLTARAEAMPFQDYRDTTGSSDGD